MSHAGTNHSPIYLPQQEPRRKRCVALEMNTPLPALLGEEHDLPPYQYERLSSPSQFRVLELLPGGGDDDPVSYRLHTADWKSPPAYEAISYAWGDVIHKYPSICDGRQHMVSLNLRAGLIAMRSRDRSRFIWVDSICIDQKNIEERGQQVTLMRVIYQGASQVLVWLGIDESSQGSRAIAAMEEIANKCLNQGTSKRQADELNLSLVEELWDLLPVEELDGLGSDTKAWEALTWLFSRSWFGRLWVIQEVNSNQNIQMLCGCSQVSWDVAVLVASYIRRHSNINSRWGFPESYYSNAYYMRRRFWHRKVSLPALLHWGRSFNATEPLDRVYALMGMPPFTKMHPPLTANYSQSKVMLYENIATRCIRETKNLRVLAYSQHPEEDKSFPSWVPQWDREARYEAINDSLTKVQWESSGKRGLPPEVEVISGILRVTGLIFDSVERVRPLGDAVWCSSQLDHPVVGIWREQGAKSVTYPTGETNLEAFSLAITAGLGQNLRKASENMDVFKASFAAYLEELLQACMHDPNPSSGMREGIGKHWFDYEDLVRRKCRNRTLFWTKTGYLGLGPACQEGDLVCILFGSEVPFILRRRNGHFQLIGDAYVHGIMEGAVINSAEPCKETQFDIH
ncbi:heterokaryon incompatibility protein-domain-containing protein [Nemania serpens]|nr:heterokaryon incompatibility protein-domain-containing protein [Nemania serpens]